MVKGLIIELSSRFYGMTCKGTIYNTQHEQSFIAQCKIGLEGLAVAGPWTMINMTIPVSMGCRADLA